MYIYIYIYIYMYMYIEREGSPSQSQGTFNLRSFFLSFSALKAKAELERDGLSYLYINTFILHVHIGRDSRGLTLGCTCDSFTYVRSHVSCTAALKAKAELERLAQQERSQIINDDGADQGGRGRAAEGKALHHALIYLHICMYVYNIYISSWASLSSLALALRAAKEETGRK